MSYSYNNQFMTRNELPWLPVMGEMHYSRFREDFWEESLRKMQAGGVRIVASYVIWIHHEEEEGIFDFTGCRDLGRFVRTCQKVGIQCFLRLGPWVHAEVRNGGFPDWLLHKKIPLRCNEDAYLGCVERFWREAFAQVKGLMYEDGGPVIGMQIENEYGHAGGLRGEAGEAHMRRLTGLAKEIGFHVPIYTATGWGGAVTGGLLPVMGGYCEAPWDQRLTEIEANENYVFTGNRNDKGIASDHHVEESLTFDPAAFPYITAELGGGLQPTHHRRPVTTGADIGAMSLAKLGSGVGLLGYYMYHGGSNPTGRYSTLQESRATGYANDLPEINYDFNAPIRQYGQISDTYKEIKLLSLFLKDFGADMATLRAEIDPAGMLPEDMDTLRTSWRHDDMHGYVFFNNYQRRRTMVAHEGIRLSGRLGGSESECTEDIHVGDILSDVTNFAGTRTDEVRFDEITIPSGAFGFFPYHMKMQDKELICATAVPLCRLDGALGTDAAMQTQSYVFYGDWEPHFIWKEGLAAEVIHLSRRDATNAWKVTLDRDYLIISEQYVWVEEGRLIVIGGRDTKIKSYPELPETLCTSAQSGVLSGFEKTGTEGIFTCYERRTPGKVSSVQFEKVAETERDSVYEITLDYGENIADCFISLKYAGDSLCIYVDDEMIEDHFYTGQEVEISMRYFDFPRYLTVQVAALLEDAPVFLEQWPEMTDGKACVLHDVRVKEEIR